MSSFSTVPQFLDLLAIRASPARFYRVSDVSVPCPCRTPEGFRDPEFHLTLLSYGLVAHEIEAGVIAPGALAYTFVATGEDGTHAYPAEVATTVNLTVPSQVKFTVSWPSRGRVTKYEIFRAEGAGSPVLIASIIKPATTYTDSTPLGAANTVLVPPVLCNEEGSIPIPAAIVDMMVKAFIQPIQSTRATRLTTEYLLEMFGNIEADDHLGIFPIVWAGTTLEFNNWSQSGDDFIEYDGARYFVVNANKIPDPGDGNPNHHWEVGLRLINDEDVVG